MGKNRSLGNIQVQKVVEKEEPEEEREKVTQEPQLHLREGNAKGQGKRGFHEHPQLPARRKGGRLRTKHQIW